MRRLLATVLAGAVLLTAGACGSSSDETGPFIAAGKRTTAPDVKGELLQGGTFDLAAHRGDVVVINFWASNCAPCRTEAPELAKTYAETKAEGVTFVGIAIRDERDAALAYLADVKPAYGSLFDPPGQYALEFKVPPSTIPSTLVVDRKGRLASVWRGVIYQEQLQPVLQKLVAEPA